MFSFNFGRWLKSWFRRKVKPIEKKRRTRLSLEQLEDRITPVSSFTWTGGGGSANPDWSLAANWGGTAPVANQTGISLFFGTPTAYSSVNNLAGLGINAITFTNSSFTLTAAAPADSINLANSAVVTVQANLLGGENLDIPMTLAGPVTGNQQFFQVESGSTLTLGAAGTITGNAGSQLTMEGGGTLIIQSSNTGFTGPFTINTDKSTVEAENSNAFGTGISANNIVTVGANSQLLLAQNPNLPAGPATNINVPNTVELNGHGTSGNNGALENLAGANTWSGKIIMENDVELDIFAGSLTVSGVISDTGSGNTLTKEGQAPLTLTNANTYRGQTLINQGVLTIENPLALGAVPSAGTVTNASASNISQGSLQLDLPAPLTTAPANSQYYILANPSAPVSAANPYIGFVVPDYTLDLNGSGFNGVYTLDNFLGDNAWSGPIVLGTAASGNVNIEVDSVGAVQTQFDITGVISDTNPATPATLNKNGTGNLVLEPTVNGATINQGNTYKLDPYGDLAQFTGQGVANNFNTQANQTDIANGTITVEDSQAFGPTTQAMMGVTVRNGAALDLVANIGHIDSVTGTTNRLQINTPTILTGDGYNYPAGGPGPDGAAGQEGALNNVSGINTYVTRAFSAIDHNVIALYGAAAIGVLADPTETSNNNYFTNDYSLTITGGIENSGASANEIYGPNGADASLTPLSAPPVQLTKVGAGQLILPTANPDYYGANVIAQGWITVQDPLSLGGEIFGSGVNVAQGAFFNTTVDSGAALMLRPLYPNTSLTLDTNLILEGDGISHAFGLINDMGAVENLEGVNTLDGNITLIGATGIGVEQVDPTILSDLTLTGQINQAQTTAAYNSVAIPATVTIPSTSGAGGVSQYTQIVDTASSQGSLVINYANFKNDNLRVYYGPIGTPGSSLIYDTTFTGTGATAAIPFGPGPGTQIEIVVDQGVLGANTAWSYSGTVTVSTGYFAGGIIKLGSQRLVLEGNGTFQGGVDIRQGIVVDDNGTALGTPLNTGEPGFTFGTTVEAGAALVLSPTIADLNGGISDGEATWGTDLTLNGSGNSTFGYAPLAVLADDNVWSGSITLDADIAIAYQGTLGNKAMPADPITAAFVSGVSAANPLGTAGVYVTTLFGTTPSADVTQTTVGSAVAGLSDVETLTFGGVVTGGTFTLTVWDGTANFTTSPITWVADPTTLIDAIQAALNADLSLKNNFAVSLVSPIINVAPDARLNVTGIVNDGATVTSPLIHSYTFTGPSQSFNDTVGSIPITPVPATNTLTAAGYTWTAALNPNNQGLTLPASALPDPTNYTIQMDFDFTDVNPAVFGGTGYDRIINFDVTPQTSANADNGLYTLADGGPGATLTAYPSGTSGPNDTFLNNVPVDLIVTRDAATGNVQAYVNGVAQFLPFGFNDAPAFPAGNEFVLQGALLEFFIDDDFVPNEVSGGTATDIKIYDRPLTAAEVAIVAAGGTLGSSTPAPADLIVAGGGELSLSGANTYRGTTYVNQGTLTIGNNQALGAAAIAGQQTISLTNAVSNIANPIDPTTFQLSFGTGAGSESAPITYTGTAADATVIQNALNALTTIGAANPVTVIQENPGVFLVTFSGVLADTQTLISPTLSSGAVTGTAVAAGFEGGTEVADDAQIQLQGGITVADEPLTIQGDGSNLEPTEQTYTVGTTTTGAFSGTYTLSFNGPTTNPLPYNATAAQVQAALENLTSVAGVGGQVAVNLLSVSAGADDTQTLFVPGTATNVTNFGLTFGPTTYDPTARSTGNIFTVASPYNPADYFTGQSDIANALNALTNVTEEGGLVYVEGAFTTVNGVAGILYTISFKGGLANQTSLPELQIQAAPAPSGPGAAGIAMESHTAGTAPSETFQVTYQGSFSGVKQPLLTSGNATLTTTVSTPALKLAGGSANSTQDQFFSDSVGTGTVSSAVTNTQSYYGVANAENAAGPVTSVAVDPTDPDVIYIATAGGGAWKTQDGGQTWQPLFDSAFAGANPAVMFGGAIAIDPTHVEDIYYATGNDNVSGFGFGLADSYYGTGVYESQNSGETWTLLTDTSNAAYTVNSSSPGNPLYGTAISKIIVLDNAGNTPGTIAVAASDVNASNGIDVNGLAGGAGVWLYDQGKWTNTTAGVTPTGSAAAFPSTNGDYVDLFYDGNTMYVSGFAGGSSAGQSAIYSVANFLAAAPGPWAWTVSDMFPGGTVPITAAGWAGGTATITAANNFIAGQKVTIAGTGGFDGTFTILTVSAAQFTYALVVNPGATPLGTATGIIGEAKLSGSTALGAPLFASEASAGSLDQIQWVDPPGGVNVWTTTASVGAGTIPDYLNPLAGYANAIYYDQKNGDVYVGGTDQDTAGVPGTNFLLQSTDNGVTWTDIVNGAAAGPQTSVQSITADANGNLVVGTDGGVWEYNITTLTWTDITGNLADEQYTSVATDPNNANIILAGGHSIGLDDYSLGALGQAVLTGAAVTSVNVLNGDSGYSQAAPPNVTFVGGGATTPATATATVNAAGVVTGITVTSGGAGYTSAPEVVIDPSGVQTWTQVAGGGNHLLGGNGTASDGGEVEFVPGDPGAVYFQEAGDLGYSTDDGVTWTATNVYTNAANASDDIPADSAPQYAPFAVDPNNPNEIIAATGGTSNVAPFGAPTLTRWASTPVGVGNALPVTGTGTASFPAGWGPITSLGIADFQGAYQADPSFTGLTIFPADHPDPSTIYVTDGKRVAVTKSLGANWNYNRGPTAAQLGNTTITDLIVDPADRDTVFLVTSGSSGASGVGHVFETTNAGQSWTDISAGLPDISVWTIAIDPYTNNLYIGTDSGVYELAGGVGAWQKFGAGLPDVMVTDININTNANVLTVATYGRGTWQLYLDDTTANAGSLRALGGNNVWGGSITLVGPTTIGVNGSQNLQDGFSGAQLTILGNISDATANALGNTLTKTGGGDLVLAGTNTYAGVTLANQGNVVADSPQALGSPGAVSLTGTTDGTDGVVTGLSSTAQLTAGMAVTGAGVAPGATIQTVNSATSVTLTSTPTAGTPLLTFNGGTQVLFFNSMVAGISQYTLSFNGVSTSAASPLPYQGVGGTGVGSDAALIQAALQGLSTINGFGSVTVTPEGGGAFLLTFTGGLDNTQLLATASIFDGPTYGVLGSSFTEVAGGTMVANGAALELESSLSLEPITLNGNGIQPPFDGHDTGALDNVSNFNTYTGTLTLNTNSTIGVTAGQLTIASVNADGIVDGGTAVSAYSLDKEGNGTLVLAGADSYQGGTTVTVGALEVENSDALGASTSSTVVSDGAQLQLSAAAGPTLTAAIPVLGAGLPVGTYYYVVTAVNANGDESLVSNEIAATPTAGNQQVILTWTAPAGTGPFTYNVYRSTIAGDFSDALVHRGIIGTTYTDSSPSTLPVTPGGLDVLGQHLYLTGSGLTNNGALANVAGNNTWAGLVTLSSVPNYSVTSSPEGVVAVYVDPANTLSLTNSINEGPPIIAPTQSTPSPITGAGLTNGVKYWYVVTAITPYGESLVSNPEFYVPSGAQDNVQLTWSPVAGATAYNVYRSLVAGSFASPSLLTTVNVTTVNPGTQYIDSGLPTGAGTPNTAASSGLAEIGAGTLVLAGYNSFSGGTYVGYVFGNVNVSGAVAPSLIGSGGVDGGVIDIENSNALGSDQGNEIQRITTYEPPNTTAQKFTLSFNGVSTPVGALTFGASAATVQAELNGLSTIDANGGTVSVSQSSVQTGLDEVQTVSLTDPTSNLNVPTGFSAGLAPLDSGNLTPSTTYYYEITAVIPGLGESLPTAQKSITTGVLATDNLSATLSWTAVAGATSYKIYRSTVAGDFNQAYLTTVAAPATPTVTFIDGGPSTSLVSPTIVPLTSSSIAVGGSIPINPVGQSYFYVVTAVGPNGIESPTSIAMTGTTTNVGANQNIITGLAATAQLTVGMGVSGASIPPGSTIVSVDGSSSVTISANALSAGSNALVFTTAVSTRITVAGDQEVHLSWGVVAGATGYRIYRSTSTNDTNSLIATINSGATTSYTDLGTVPASVSPPVQTQYTLSFGGKTTPLLSYLGVGGTAAGSDALNIQTALQALTSIGANNVIVTPDATDTIFTITFVGALADTPESTITPVAGAVMTGTYALLSNSVTGLLSTSQLVPGMLVSGTGIPTGATIVAINSGSALTISADATVAGAAAALTFTEPQTSAAGAETTPGDGGLSIIYTVQFNGTPLNSAAQALLVVATPSNELTVAASEAATGGIGALVYNGAALQVDGDPAETGASISIPAGETLALNGNGFETLTLESATALIPTTFTLQVGSGPYTVGVNETAAITYTGADAGAVQAALNALTAITGTVGSVQVAQTNTANTETFVITGLTTSADVTGTVTSADPAIFDAPAVVAGALVNTSGNNLWQGDVILQSSSTVAAAATTQLTVTGLVQDAPFNAASFAAAAAATPDPTTSPATLTKVGAGTVSLAPATQVINLTDAVSTLDAPTLNAPVYSNGGAINSTFFYEVTAIGLNGETMPSLPESTALGGLTSQIVNLTWTNAAGFTASGYRVYRSPTGVAGTFTLLANIDSGSTLTYQDNGSTALLTGSPPTQTQFTLSAGVGAGFTTGAITYTGATSLASTGVGSIQTLLNAVLTAKYPGVTATVIALNANSFTVTYTGAAAALAAVPPLTGSVVLGTPGSVAINTNTFSGDVYDNAGVLNIQSAQALGVTTSAVEEVAVNGTSGTFQLIFNGQTTGVLQDNLPASGGASPTASVQNALNALSSINANGVTVTQVGNNYFVYFNGPGLANHYQNPITYVKPLSAGTTSIVITHPLAGGASNIDVASGATLQTQSNSAAQAFKEDSGKYLTIAGQGFGGEGALDNLSGTNFWNATPITLGSTAAIGAAAGSTLDMNTPITDSFLTPTIQFSGFKANDTYSLSYGGAVTGALTYLGVTGAVTVPAVPITNDADQIQQALLGLSSVIALLGPTGTVNVTWLGGHSYDVTFSNTLYGTFAPGIGSIPISSAGGSFVSPVPPTTSNDFGVNKVGAGIVSYNVGNTYTGLTNVVAGTLEFNNSTAPGSGFAVPGNLQVGDATLVPQVQTLTFSSFFQQLDQFTLTYGATTTAPITYYQNPSYEAAAIQAALNAAPPLGLGTNFASVTATSATTFLIAMPGLGNTVATTLITGADITTPAGSVGSVITSVSAASATPGSAGAPIAQLEASTTATTGQINPASTVTVLNDGLFDLHDMTQTIDALTVIGGVARTGASAGVGGNLTVTGNVLIDSGGALDLPGNGDVAQIDGTLTLIGGSVNLTGVLSTLNLDNNNLIASSDAGGASAITGQGTLALNDAAPLFTINAGGQPTDLLVSAPISSTATTGLTKAGAGRLELAAVNTYQNTVPAPGANTTIDAGDVQVDSVFTVQFSTSPVWTTGDSFELTYSNGLDGVGAINGATNPITYNTSASVTVGNILAQLVDLLMAAPFNFTAALANADLAVVPVLGNPNLFTIAFLGAAASQIGTLSFTAVSSAHGGAMTVTPTADIGNVVLNGSTANSASVSGTGIVGTGTPGTPAISIAPGAFGTVNPGNNGTNPAAPGILPTSGDVTFSPGSGTFFVDLNNLSSSFIPNAGTDYDQLNVNGNVTLNNALLAGGPSAGANVSVCDTFTIMQATGTISGFLYTNLYGIITQIPNNGSVFLNGENFAVRYNTAAFGAGPTNNNIVLTLQQSSLTAFSLTSSANPSVYGQDVTFTALATPVFGASFAALPDVTFNLDGTDYDEKINPAVQEVSLNGFSNGNTFTLTYFNGLQAGTTTAIPYTGTPLTDAASIATALNNMLTSAPFNFAPAPVPVSVVPVDATDFTITFGGVAATDIYPLLGTVTSGPGTISLASVAAFTPQSTLGTVWSPTNGTPHVITATFNDSTDVFASPVPAANSPLNQVVNQNTVNIALSSNLAGGQATYGQDFNLTAMLAPAAPLNLPAPPADEPTGSLSFYVDGNPVASMPTTGFTFPSLVELVPGNLLLTPGPHTIDVTYSGDANYAATASIATFQYTYTVVADSTTLAFTPAPVSSFLGQDATFNVAVTPGLGVSSPGHPQGTVNFYDGNPLAGGTLLNGTTTTASFTIPGVGSSTTMKVLSANFLSLGQSLTITAGGNSIVASVTGISAAGVTIMTTAIVTGNAGATMATDATVVLQIPIDALLGTASFSLPTYSALKLGSHNIYAVFTASNNDYIGATNSFSGFMVQTAQTQTVIQTPLPSASYGVASTFHVQVSENPAIVFPSLPTGNVVLYAQTGTPTATTASFVIPGAPGAPSPITAAAWAGGFASITAANSFAAGQTVVIAGMTPAGYNGTYTIATASGTGFTYAVANPGGAGSAFGAAMLKPTTVTINVGSNAGMSAGAYLDITDGSNTIIAVVTGTTGVTQATIQTVTIIAGSAGNTMADLATVAPLIDLGTGAMSGSGLATIVTQASGANALPIGSNIPLLAVYPGDNNFGVSQDTSQTITVTGALANVAVTSASPNPGIYTGAIALTASVTSPVHGLPTGEAGSYVTFWDGAVGATTSTTAAFAIVAVTDTTSIQVASVTGLAMNQPLYITDGTNTITATITAVGPGNSVTIDTTALIAGLVGNTMASAASVANTTLGTTELAAAGTASLTVPAGGLPGGLHTLYASYADTVDGQYLNGVDTPLTNFAVDNEPTTVTSVTAAWTTSPTALVYEQPVAFSATVTLPAGTLTGGAVTFVDSTTNTTLGSAPVVSGAASLAAASYAGLTVGANILITATYSDAPSLFFKTSSATLPNFTVTAAPTAITLTSSFASSTPPDTSALGQAVTYTATVQTQAPDALLAVKTGSVSFWDVAPAALATVTGAGFNIPAVAGTTTASFGFVTTTNETLYIASGGNAFIATVVTANASVTIRTTALLTGAVGQPIGAGTSVFAAALLSPSPVTVNAGTGLASVSITYSTVAQAGTHTIFAVYNPPTVAPINYLAATPVSLTQTVLKTSAVSTAAVSNTWGQALSYTVKVTSPLGGGSPTGTVVVTEGGIPVPGASGGTLSPSAGGSSTTITIPANTLNAGPNSLVFTYTDTSAIPAYASSSATIAQTVTPATTSMTLASSVSGTSEVSEPVTFTAVLTVGSAGTPGLPPSGTVTIKDSASATPLQTVTLTGSSFSSGPVTVIYDDPTSSSITIEYTTTALTLATHTVTAIYSGSNSASPPTEDFGPSTSSAVTQKVAAGGTLGALVGAAQWTQNSAYSATITFTKSAGATGTLTPASVSASNLPIGLSVTGVTNTATTATITISGTPTVTGTFAPSISVTDSANAVVTKTYANAITINPPAVLNFTPASPAAGYYNTAFSATATISGGTGPFTLQTTTPGTLPPGLTATLSGTKITISGKPTAAAVTVGTYTFTINAKDAAGNVVSTSYTINVQAAPTTAVITAAPATALVGSKVTFTVVVTSSGPATTGGLTFNDPSAPGGVLSGGTLTLTSTTATTATYSYSYTFPTSAQRGLQAVTATYNGSTDFAASSASSAVNVNVVNTAMALSASTLAPGPNANVTFTATFTAAGGSATGQTVFFYDNGVQIGSAILGAGAVSGSDTIYTMTFTKTFPSGSKNVITASFLGDEPLLDPATAAVTVTASSTLR